MEIPLTVYILGFSSLPIFPWELGLYRFLLHTHGFVFAFFFLFLNNFPQLHFHETAVCV